MRKTLIILALACASVLALSDDAFAQRRGGGGRGNGGGRGYSGGRGYAGGRGYYGGRDYDGGRGWGGDWGGVGIGIGLPGYYGGGGYYGRGYDDGAYYYPSDSYSYPDAYVGPANSIQQSYYPPTSQQTATVQVMVPNPTAQVWFNGAATSQQGMNRSFYTPALEPGNYSYTVKARWMENGQPVERERTVAVQPGQTMSVNFRTNPGETLPLPKK